MPLDAGATHSIIWPVSLASRVRGVIPPDAARKRDRLNNLDRDDQAARAIGTLIAQLGGYIRRKDSAPGTQTVWIGMQRGYDPALAWELFGPESKMKGS